MLLFNHISCISAALSGLFFFFIIITVQYIQLQNICIKKENQYFPAVPAHSSKNIYSQSNSRTSLVIKKKKKRKKRCSPSTHEGLFLVVPATFPGKQEHLTVCDRSSMRFLLQHLCAAITSHVPPSDKEGREREKSKQIKSASRRDQTEPTHRAERDKNAT